MTSPYEELYGVHLLDDLHNHFPALLYEPERFQQVPQILGYIQNQARNRFELFALGQHEYRERVLAQNETTSNIPDAVEQPNSNLPNDGPIPPDEQGETILLTNQMTGLTTRLMQVLMSLPLSPPTATATGTTLNSFLEPVVIRPTAEQIAENTTLGNLVSDTEHLCAVCQDSLQPEQEGRKFNVCGHWFHTICIDTWLERNVHCPVCRHDIRESTITNNTNTNSETTDTH